ncbi:hypothetical protein Y1Q_0024564 [Alligator mississippiensis]|uniref:Uncharacterized protein n=1 Tax=Alligator mississippiensis TaxID=8496 RepID=A0A151NAX7_ALLMI|nr:hypothetical protein Y1Q_0024564 [Alligator mississippiensis]
MIKKKSWREQKFYYAPQSSLKSRSHEFGRLDALHPYFTDGITETQKGCMHSGSKEWLRLFRLFFLVQTTGTQEIKESA